MCELKIIKASALWVGPDLDVLTHVTHSVTDSVSMTPVLCHGW